VCIQLCCKDSHLGLATLLGGSLRAVGGSVAVVVYTAVIQNTMEEDIGPRVARATIPLGLPRSSIAPMIEYLSHGRVQDAMKLPGVTSATLRAAEQAVKASWGNSFK